MRDYLITFKSGETKKITAQSFSSGCSSSNLHFFNEKGEPLAYYTEVQMVELAESPCCKQAAPLAPGTVINTAGQPAAEPPPGGWSEAEAPKRDEPAPGNVASPS